MLAHCWRYSFKELESEPERAREALALIGELFRIERQIPNHRRAGATSSVSASRDPLRSFVDGCRTEVTHSSDF